MKLGILLIVIGLFITVGWLHTYIVGGDTIMAGIAELLIGFPCMYIGIGRIKKHRRSKRINTDTIEIKRK